MTALLYYSISSGLSENEAVAIDKEVCRNRKLVYKFITKLPLNAKRKGKKVIVVISLGVALCFSNVQPADAIGLSLPPAPVVRVQPSYEHPSEVKIASTVNKRSDKVRLMPSKEIIPLIYLNAQHVYVNEKILKRLRAGGFEESLVLIAIGVVVFLTFQLSGTDAFAILNQLGRINAPSVNPGFGPTVNPTSTEIALVPTQA